MNEALVRWLFSSRGYIRLKNHLSLTIGAQRTDRKLQVTEQCDKSYKSILDENVQGAIGHKRLSKVCFLFHKCRRKRS